MTPASLTRARGEGVASSIFEAGGMCHACVMVCPPPLGAFSEQQRDGFARLARALEDAGLTRDQVVAQTVFLRSAADEELCRRIVADCFGGSPPVTTVVLQPPCTGAAVAIEAWATQAEVRRDGPDTVSVEGDGLRWVFSGDLVVERAAVYEQTQAGFRELARRLAGAGAAVGDIVRTWLYLGEITGLEPETETERYRILNRSRADTFASVSFGRIRAGNPGGGYPASTGIGAAGRSLRMGCLALETQRRDVAAIALENPRQVAAYHYDPAYGARAPVFSRAVAIDAGSDVIVLVSGTASITDSKTMHVGDPRAQTHLTLDNIEALICSENLARHGAPRADMTLHSVVSARVYVKRAEDYEACRAICEERMPGVPLVYVVADVCRPELLVEIEGLALAPVRT